MSCVYFMQSGQRMTTKQASQQARTSFETPSNLGKHKKEKPTFFFIYHCTIYFVWSSTSHFCRILPKKGKEKKIIPHPFQLSNSILELITS